MLVELTSTLVGVALTCLSARPAHHSGGSSCAAASLLSVRALSSCFLMTQALYTASVSRSRSLRVGCPELLGFPFFQVFLGELVPYVEPQGGMCSHIVPPKSRAVGHPQVNVPDEGVGQLTRLMEVAPIQMASHMILPKLQEHGHPGPHRWAAHANIFVVGARRNQWQFPSRGHRRLDVFQRA